MRGVTNLLINFPQELNHAAPKNSTSVSIITMFRFSSLSLVFCLHAQIWQQQRSENISEEQGKKKRTC